MKIYPGFTKLRWSAIKMTMNREGRHLLPPACVEDEDDSGHEVAKLLNHAKLAEAAR